MTTETKKSPTLTSEPIFLKETSEQTFSANYVIHAYEQGRKKGMNDKMIELQSDAKTQFVKNRDYTVNVINKLVTELLSDGIMTRRGWIKHESVNIFDAIIGIPEKDYLSEEIDNFYIKAHQIESQSNNPEYHLNIRFINNDKEINEEKLYCDGYQLKFDIQIAQRR